jgi:hypothetical protein
VRGRDLERKKDRKKERRKKEKCEREEQLWNGKVVR